jgi:hypothetical protein
MGPLRMCSGPFFAFSAGDLDFGLFLRNADVARTITFPSVFRDGFSSTVDFHLIAISPHTVWVVTVKWSAKNGNQPEYP